MPTQSPIDCPKGPYDWEDRAEQDRGQGGIRRRSRSIPAPKKKCAEWSYRVREMYDIPRRILRVYRWCKRSRFGTSRIDHLFRQEADCWKDETRHWSSVKRRFGHPSYLRIIALAKYSTNNELERLLLQELREDPDHWFDALTAVTGEDPIRPEYNFDEAVDAWLEWGRKKGIT